MPPTTLVPVRNSGDDAEALHKSDSKRFLRSFSTVMVLRVCATIASIALNISICRSLGASDAGLFFIAMSFFTITSAVGRMGLDRTLVRFVAESVAKQDWGAVAAFRQIAHRIVIFTSAAIGLSTFVLAGNISHLLNSTTELKFPIQLFAAATIPACLLAINGALLSGLNLVPLSVVIVELLPPALATGLFILLTRTIGVVGAVGAFAVATALAWLISGVAWRLATPKSGPASEAIDRRAVIVKSGLVLWTTLASLISGQIGSWALAYWANSKDIAYFNASARVSLVISFVLMAIVSAYSPMISTLLSTGDIQRANRLTQKAVLISACCGLLIVVPMLIVPEFLLTLFGADFAEGASALRILSIGQLVNSSTGPVGAILLMSGNERTVSNAFTISMMLSAILTLALTPLFGLVGAAIGTAVAVAYQNLHIAFMVRPLLGVSVWPSTDLFTRSD